MGCASSTQSDREAHVSSAAKGGKDGMPQFQFCEQLVCQSGIDEVSRRLKVLEKPRDRTSLHFAHRTKMIRFIRYVDGDIMLMDQDYFVQPDAYNDFSGGIKRHYPLIPPDLMRGPLRGLILTFCKKFKEANREVLLVQVQTTFPKMDSIEGKRESVTGQGVHTDGHERAALAILERENITGAENVFHRELDGSRPLCPPKVLMPGDVVFWKDNEIFHQVMPIECTRKGEDGKRTVMLIHSPAELSLTGELDLKSNSLGTRPSDNSLRRRASWLALQADPDHLRDLSPPVESVVSI